MIILISGCSHTGKTLLAQKLLEKLKYPYLSIDHLKMGLIRSGQTSLTPCDDKELTPYLWSIVREIVRTAVENNQNLIIEGCYIPFNWRNDFESEYLKSIVFRCLIMTKEYIEAHFSDINAYENVVESRLGGLHSGCEQFIAENEENLEMCKRYGCEYVLIDGDYNTVIEQALILIANKSVDKNAAHNKGSRHYDIAAS